LCGSVSHSSEMSPHCRCTVTERSHRIVSKLDQPIYWSVPA
jgi:hypothetical protein